MLVELSGDMDFSMRDQLAARLDQAAVQSDRVDVELSKANYVDSTILGLLIGLRNRLRERGGTLRLVSPSPHMRKLLSYSGLDKAFEIIESPASS